MGGSVAVHAADQVDAPWTALVVVSSFDSFASAIDGQAIHHAGVTLGPLWSDASDAVFRWKSGVSIKEIQPCQHAASIGIPTLIAHGTADHVVSMESGRRLFDSLPDSISKKWVEIPGAGHDNVLITAYPIYADIAEWMLRHVSRPWSPDQLPERGLEFLRPFEGVDGRRVFPCGIEPDEVLIEGGGVFDGAGLCGGNGEQGDGVLGFFRGIADLTAGEQEAIGALGIAS